MLYNTKNILQLYTCLAMWKHQVNLLSQSFRSVSSVFISANNNTIIISTDEDPIPSLRIESFATINLHGVSTKLKKYTDFTMQTYKELIL